MQLLDQSAPAVAPEETFWTEQHTLDSDVPRTGRVARLQQRLMDGMLVRKPGWVCDVDLCADPAVAARPCVVRRALAIDYVLIHMPIRLAPEEPFAGNLRIPPRGGKPSFPNYTLPTERAEAAKWGFGPESVFGHCIPRYDLLFEKGLEGIRGDIAARRAEIEAAPDSSEKPEQLAFLEAADLSCEAAERFAQRYVDLAERLAAKAKDPCLATEYRAVAAACRRVPALPARTFREAVQAFWLMHCAYRNTETQAPSGRIDQYLWPYLEADLAEGRISCAEAQELVECVFVKFSERAQLKREHMLSYYDEKAIDATCAAMRRARYWRGSDPYQVLKPQDLADNFNHWIQTVIVGGVRPADGDDATNLLTYMCLEATRKLELTNPVMNLRLHKGSPRDLVQKACETLRSGGGQPFLFNDEGIIPAFLKMGYPIEEARDYTNDSCWETLVSGKTEFLFCRVSTVKPVEWVLNRGRALSDGLQEGLDTSDPLALKTWDDFWRAYTAQLDELVGHSVRMAGESYGHNYPVAADPLFSVLCDDCIARARDFTNGGAKYISYAIIANGMSHAADSLTAIKKLVYEQKALCLADLIEAVRTNYEGREPLRQMLQRAAPKYGNDDDYADGMVRDVLDFFTATVARHAKRYPHIKFPPGAGTFAWYLPIGRGLGATPDGRLSGAPIASDFSPSLGADTAGPTATLCSFVKMHLDDLQIGSPLDIKLSGPMVNGEEGLRRFMGYLDAFVQLGGNQLTVTVTDNETLRQAQQEPEKYRNLRVRMGGWSAFFVALSSEQQEHIIQRNGYM